MTCNLYPEIYLLNWTVQGVDKQPRERAEPRGVWGVAAPG